MSKSIGLVIEGKTDLYILEAALKALVTEDVSITMLQPDFFGEAVTRGEGWGGIYRWCQEYVDNPVCIEQLALTIICLDADVSAKKYQDINVRDNASDLPCVCPCPPAENTVAALRAVVKGWLGGAIPNQVVLCIPSWSIDTWLVPVLFPNEPKMLENLECQTHVYPWLARRAVGNLTSQTGKKNVKAYRLASQEMVSQWSRVTSVCDQARNFEAELKGFLT